MIAAGDTGTVSERESECSDRDGVGAAGFASRASTASTASVSATSTHAFPEPAAPVTSDGGETAQPDPYDAAFLALKAAEHRVEGEGRATARAVWLCG
jgi:hypothetical protein